MAIVQGINRKRVTVKVIDNEINQFNNNISSLNSREKFLEKLRGDFVNYFDAAKISQMTIKEYVVGHGKKDSFCYRLETELKELGDIHGSTSDKFGIYFSKKKQKNIFTKKYGTTEEEAFEEIKKQILNLISDGKKGDINAIRENKLAPTVRGKILSVYFPNDYFCVFTDEHLDYFMNILGIRSDKSDDIIEKQKKLIEWKNKKQETKSWTNHIFSEFLYRTFGSPNKNMDSYSEKNEDAVNLEAVNQSNIQSKNTSFKYSGKPKKKGKPSIINGYTIYPRKKKVSINALIHANFECEIDNKHQTFQRKKSEINYTEPHHLVPMAYSDEFKASLDVEENIVSLCSNCHNQIHYGKGANVLLEKLYNERKDLLEKAGIEITFERLLKMYNI